MTQPGDALTLRGLVDALQSARTLEATLDAAVQCAPALLGVTQCALFLRDTVENRFLPVAAAGMDPDAVAAFYSLDAALTTEILRPAIETREPVVVRRGGDVEILPIEIVVRRCPTSRAVAAVTDSIGSG